MPSPYPWPAAPEYESATVRLRPGDPPEAAVVVEWAGERFLGVRPASLGERELLPQDPTVFCSPGLFDVQINGYQGRGFKDVDLGPSGVRDLCWSIALTGTTRFLATITTDSLETMSAAMENVDAACRAYPDIAAMVAGIHQEGPWLSPADGPRGAHPREYISLPAPQAFEHLQAAAGGRIAVLTLAPEVRGGLSFIRRVSRMGVTVCLGHHNADGETIRRAVEAGARGVTHLGNGCHNLMPRHPNVLWEQAAEDRLYAGIIVDGHHLPPSTVKVLYRAKPRDKLFLVSDAVAMAGAPPGLYRTRGGIAELRLDGRFGFYRSPTLIGAAVPLSRCLANLTRFVSDSHDPTLYLPHVTTVPAALTGLPGSPDALGKPGAPATFVVWHWDGALPDLVPQRIVLLGRTIYDAQSLPTAVPFGRTAEPVTLEEADRWLAARASPHPGHDPGR